ncbi:hypothetical protein [Pedobacter foliorum]|uniref:hypothetical protein n=1 Tax=Pedobacter foliorum TaxID=2739058 RepID=UPI0015649FA1|nr:hypothetical protein [Pedobacter foliorum]NRF37582.1 hypothetical protein [Pedobacter foliorum]
MKKLVLNLAFISLTNVCFAQKIKDFTKVPALVKEAKKEKNIRLADSIAKNYINNYLFKLRKDNLLSKENLLFISENLGDTDSKGFKYFLKNRVLINSVLGKNKAEYAIKYAIAKQFIPKMASDKSTPPNWLVIENELNNKFGSLGKEVVFGRMMLYYINNQDWSNFGKYYVLYFEMALERPEVNINDMSWYGVFEHINDSKILTFACDVVMKYAMEEWYQNDWRAFDTYANLLYKTGNIKQAIEWEEKAVKLSNNDKEIVETLGKMKNNIKTWVETAKN